MRVPFFRYPHVFEQTRNELESAFQRVASAGSYILQEDLREFEYELAAYVGCADVIGVGNATDGLEMILAQAGVGPGDEVILPSHTFVASASAVVVVGATPVYVEIQSDHLIDVEDIERRLTSRTKAIMPTQLNGRVADMPRILQIAEEHDLVVLEDSAQGIGALLSGQMAGTFGFAGVLSFYPAKVLGTLGDGGAILCNDPSAAVEFRRARDHGRDPDTGEVMRWGRNSRLDNLHAALLREKLTRLDNEIECRRALAARYHQNLSDLPELVLPPAPETGGAHFDTFQNYEIEADIRDGLQAYLRAKGVATILQWDGKGVHEIEALGSQISLPITERILRRSLLLPMNTSLSLDELDYVSETIRAFYQTRTYLGAR